MAGLRALSEEKRHGRNSNDKMITIITRKKWHRLVDENKRLRDEVTGLMVTGPDGDGAKVEPWHAENWGRADGRSSRRMD